MQTIIQTLYLKIVCHFRHVRQTFMVVFYWGSKLYLHCNDYVQFVPYSDNYSDGVPPNNADLTTDDSHSFKYKAALAGKTTDAVNNTSSSVKKDKNTCSIKVSKQLLEIIRNAINQLRNSSKIKLDWKLHFMKCWRFCKI